MGVFKLSTLEQDIFCIYKANRAGRELPLKALIVIIDCFLAQEHFRFKKHEVVIRSGGGSRSEERLITEIQTVGGDLKHQPFKTLKLQPEGAAVFAHCLYSG